MLIEGVINLKSLKACVTGVDHLFINESEIFEMGINGNLDSNVIVWNTCFFVTAEGNIEEQIRTIMRINSAKKLAHANSCGVSIEEYEKLGYTSKLIK